MKLQKKISLTLIPILLSANVIAATIERPYTYHGLEDGNIVFSVRGGKVILTLTGDGRVVLGKGVKPTQAAQEFLKILQEMYPNWRCSKGKY